MREADHNYGDGPPAALHPWIDPYAGSPGPPVREVVSAPLKARVAAVLIDFVLFKVATSFIALAVTGVSMVALMGGADADELSRSATNAAWSLNALVALAYFILWPALRKGRTVGRRLTGISLRSLDQRAVQPRLAGYDLLVFCLPCLVLNPIAILELREFAVPILWCAIQVLTSPAGPPYAEQAFGLEFVVTESMRTDG